MYTQTGENKLHDNDNSTASEVADRIYSRYSSDAKNVEYPIEKSIFLPKCQQVGELLSKESNIISFAVIAKWHAVSNFPHAYYSKEEPENRMITMRPNKEAKAWFDKNKRIGDNS